MSFLGLSKLAPEERKHTAEMPEYYYCLIFLGCVAPVFAACCVPFDRFRILRVTATVVLVLLGIVLLAIQRIASWIGDSPPDLNRFWGTRGALAAFLQTVWSFICAGATCLGIFAISAIIRVVWTWVRSPAKTSPEDSVPHDQVAQATSAPESSNGDPYPESATWD